MNTYLIPTTAAYCYEPYDHIYLVYANTPLEAYQTACNNLQGEYIPQKSQKYESYPFELYKPDDTATFPFPESQKYGILTEAFKNTKGAEYMSYFQVNWNRYTDQLSQKAYSENQSGTEIQFLTGYELGRIGIKERPERANYFGQPELLLFDWHYPIDVHYTHILDDERNKQRLPKEFLKSANKINILNGALDSMKKKVSANYKLAVPQYYEGKIQLLLPLCLMSDTKPDVAIAVTKKDNSYQGHTCLTLDMAYNNARLIAKPESNWLSI